MKRIPDYRSFVASLHEARPRHYLGHAHCRIAHEQAFAEMRDHLVKMHSGLRPVHSFIDGNGAVFDCIPVESQVSLRGARGRIVRPPGRPRPSIGQPTIGHSLVQLHPKFTDRLGNRMAAPTGTIPVRRHTMADLANYRSLRDWLAKRAPVGKSAPKKGKAAKAQAAVPGADATHWYAYGAEAADNIGGGGTLNVWDPPIGAGQNMSLSQLWFADQRRQQTVEVGWQVNPGRFGSTKPVLFVYWTADNYRTTGCYNLTCSGFVQTNGQWALGGALPAWSTAGGQQVELAISVLLDQDKWWIYLDGEGPEHALGYYPASLYGDGTLAGGAAQLLCGGEVAGTTSAPPMGSGAFADAGWQQAAFQRDIHYTTPSGSRRDAELGLSQPTRRLFTAKSARSSPPWGSTLWFGGPGGKPS